MKTFKVHNKETAQSPADNILAAVETSLGFVPNLFGIIAESPVALTSFVQLNEQFSKSSMNAMSREIVQIAVSVENACNYCVAGHSAFAEIQNVPGTIVEAIRNNQPIEDSKLEALNQFTRLVVRNKGFIADEAVQEFLNAGYTPAHVMEVILGICVKTFSNLANNIIGIPLDDEFSKYAWHADTEAVA
jgi:uncharacterized peroxidase-related enzyme